jgi:hypothetical protein
LSFASETTASSITAPHQPLVFLLWLVTIPEVADAFFPKAFAMARTNCPTFMSFPFPI